MELVRFTDAVSSWFRDLSALTMWDVLLCGMGVVTIRNPQAPHD